LQYEGRSCTFWYTLHGSTVDVKNDDAGWDRACKLINELVPCTNAAQVIERARNSQVALAFASVQPNSVTHGNA